ncbi:hypothetical protein JCM10207_005762 [Rhodosporidiobolus poonsookiae]
MLSTKLLARAVRPRALPPSSASPHFRLLSTSPSLYSRPSPVRYEASSVSKKPASDDLKDMRQNAAEEARGVARTVAEAVAGANDSVGQRGGRENYGAGDISADINAMASLTKQVPREVITWGAAGLLPYAGTSLATIHFARQAYNAHELGPEQAGISVDAACALLEHVQLLQIQYGAIILSFLGAVHWGFEWSKFGGIQGNRRYMLGVAPVLAGWSTLLVTGQLALVAQWAAFFGMWYVDQRATTNGWTPRWYSTYRFWLTSVVGGSILISLAAQGYYSLDPNIARAESQLKEMKEGKAPSSLPKGDKVQLGEMRAEKATDAYVKFTNVEKEKQKEEEEKKKAEEEAQKKKEEEEEAAKQAELDKVKAQKESEKQKALKEQIAKIENK